MLATDILSSEHQVILRVITTLEKAAGHLEAGQSIAPEFFLDATDFIKGFADGCHHRKEEGVLFKALNQHGVPENTGPVAVMLAEHERGRQFTRGLHQAALALQAGDPAAQAALVANARGYAALLRQHIHKEDHILFPLANQVIPLENQAQVADEFETVEHEETGAGVHEKYLALAEKLEHSL